MRLLEVRDVFNTKPLKTFGIMISPKIDRPEACRKELESSGDE